MNQTKNNPVEMGRILATPGILARVPRHELIAAINRHRHGDWGDACDQDRQANDSALRNGGRILSVYRSTGGTRFWIITEADRSYTTALLPSEY